MSHSELHKTIGPYQVQTVIGHGGMATVYKALQPELDRVVAIKIPLPAFMNDATFRLRFQHEARLIARLRHPHIVVVHSVGEDHGVPYLVMEYVRGVTLYTAIHQRRRAGEVFSPAEARAILRPLAGALDYAHDQGVIHRDLKPENIILTDHGPVITDFGLARLVQEEAAPAGLVIGTPAYMAPEQIEARPLDRRTDVYALGILLYELLAGQVPFNGPTVPVVTQAHLHRPAPALAELNPRLRLSPGLEEVARRAIAKRQEERWPSAGAFVAALTGAASTTTAVGALRQADRRPSRGASSAPLTPARTAPLESTPASRHSMPPPPRRIARLERPSVPDGSPEWIVFLSLIVVMVLGGLLAARGLAPEAGPVAAAERSAAIHATVEPAMTSPPAPTAEPTATSSAVGAGVTGPIATSIPTAPPEPIGTPGPTPAPAATEAPVAGSAAEQAAWVDGAVRGRVRSTVGAYLRGGPGTDYPIVASLRDATAVTALNQAPDWLEIVAETGERAWIARELVEIESGDLASLPSPAVPPP